MNVENPVAHVHYDAEGAKTGMWLFLFTEVLLFGALFLVYGVYHYLYPEEFFSAASHLDVFIGTMNTIILLTSSLTMAMSITAIMKSDKKRRLIFLGTTILLAVLFLINKYFEWGAKIHHGIYPGSPELLAKPHGEVLFFGLYYFMTGLHGLHIVIGIVAISIVMWMVAKGKIDAGYPTILENVGLYWHIVDIIWIFLFPLFYLIK